MDAFAVDVLRYSLTAAGLAWVGYWEHREQRIQAALKLIRIKFQAADGADAPGYFVWAPAKQSQTPSATDAHQAWLDSLTDAEWQLLREIDELTPRRAA